ncbi:MAG TPA: type IV pilus assembly protein PilM [Solirubrobacterales bacterium]|nr:type IV pilus assembly protein PilM [Solirubrobacterales bacterium]
MLQIGRQRKPGRVVGVEIEAGGIAAAEVDSGRITAAALGPLAPGAFHEGEVADVDLVAQALKALFSQHKLSKRVRLGIGNQRVVVRTLRLPAIDDPKELEAAVRFQAQEQIPMPPEQAVLEHQVVGTVPGEEGAPSQMEVVVVAARREMVGQFVEPLRRAGLEPVGIDLSAFAMIRALADAAGAGATAPAFDGGGSAAPMGDQATLYCNLGDIMNLAVARGRSCLFTRVSMVGLEGIVRRLATETGLIPDHASQWLMHVGLERPVEQIEGDPRVVSSARTALEAGVGSMVDEMRMSLDYYAAQEGAVPAGQIVICGPGSAIPGLVSAVESGIGLPVVATLPPAFSGYDPDVAARFTLAYGLALEN